MSQLKRYHPAPVRHIDPTENDPPPKEVYDSVRAYGPKGTTSRHQRGLRPLGGCDPRTESTQDRRRKRRKRRGADGGGWEGEGSREQSLIAELFVFLLVFTLRNTLSFICLHIHFNPLSLRTISLGVFLCRTIFSLQAPLSTACRPLRALF